MIRAVDAPISGELMIVCAASVPAGSMRRVEERSRDQLAGRLQPVVREAGLERRHRRPFDPDLHVAPFARVPRVAAPVVRDAGAAGERDAAVDDERLAVGPVVEAAEAVEADRVVPGELAAAALEDFEDLLADASAEPTASSRILTRTPAAALAASASANCRPMSPAQ